MNSASGKIRPLKHLVLLVEDHRNNQFVLCKMLEAAGVKVISASNGAEAIELFRNYGSIELVLMDLKMPVMDGYQTMKEIRNINPGAIIVAQTAYALPGDKERIIEAGFDDYLAKPVTIEDLKALISEFLTD